MQLHLRHGVACMAAMTLWSVLSLPAGAQDTKYTIKVIPPGGPAPRLADGHPGLSGHWLPNGAGQGVTCRYAVAPSALATFAPKGTPETRPELNPGALEKCKSMTPTTPPHS